MYGILIFICLLLILISFVTLGVGLFAEHYGISAHSYLLFAISSIGLAVTYAFWARVELSKIINQM